MNEKSPEQHSDWSCTACTLLNKASASVCAVCTKPRHRQPEQQQWSCTTCTLLNKASANVCAVCTKPRPRQTQRKECEADVIERRIDEYEHKLLLSDVTPENTFNLATLYLHRIRGERANNLEKSIELLRKVLTVWTRSSRPYNYAVATNSLANVYCQRIHGSTGDNIDKAIKLYESCLLVYTRQSYPAEWAMTTNNLAAAYSDRIHGSTGDNIDKAIKLYESCLLVYTRQSYPADWAMTTNNLANAYRNRIHGSTGDNIDKAIKLYESCLLVRTRQSYPAKWAMTTNNLAIAYRNRIHGSRGDNIDKAIKLFESSLLVRTRQSYPAKWAMTTNNLATAYYNRIHGSRGDNLDKAIQLFERSLLVRTRQSYPANWAMTTNNLAVAYSKRVHGSTGDNIDKAIKLYERSLLVRTRQSYPAKWADTTYNIALAYIDRIHGTRLQNLSKSSKLFQTCNHVWTQKLYPAYWAKLQIHTARVVRYQIQLQQSNSSAASASFPHILSNLHRAHLVCQHNRDHHGCARCCKELGLCYVVCDKPEDAKKSFIKSIEHIEELRSRIRAGMETKKRLAENWSEVYRRLVDVCVRLKQTEEAWKFAEAAKSRNLLDLLHRRSNISRLKTKRLVDKYWRLLTNVLKEQNRLSARAANDTTKFSAVDTRRLISLQKELSQFVSKHIPDYVAMMNKVEKIGLITWKDVRRLVQRDVDAIVEWFVGMDNVYTFVITRSGMRVFVGGKGGSAALKSICSKYSSLYRSNRREWMGVMEAMLTKIGLCLNVDDVAKHLIALKCLSVVFVPHWFLHAIPLHAIPLHMPHSAIGIAHPTMWKCKGPPLLMDLFRKGIRYAPSCHVLLMVQRKLNRKYSMKSSGTSELKAVSTGKCDVDEVKYSVRAVSGHGLEFINLVGINNPDFTLRNTELDCIQRFWNAPKFVFSGGEARLGLFVPSDSKDNMIGVGATSTPNVTTTATTASSIVVSTKPLQKAKLRNRNDMQSVLQDCECLHFNCHGTFNITRPMESGLLLAHKQMLLLRDVFSLRLPNCKLVTLSACETGLIDIDNESDECLGLPSAFLFAGAAHTVGSLWAVYDSSTTVLMVKFYELLRKNKRLSIPEALWQSQQWYRNLDDAKRPEITSQLLGASQAKKVATRETLISSSFLPSVSQAQQKQFLDVTLHSRHPVHWAAFICVG